MVVTFAAPTVTSGVILSIVLLDTPALERSATEPYGRPAMILPAVAFPTPGSPSSSFSLAVLRSMSAPPLAVVAAVSWVFVSLALVVFVSPFVEVVVTFAAPTVTSGVILSIVLLDTPALERSTTEA